MASSSVPTDIARTILGSMMNIDVADRPSPQFVYLWKPTTTDEGEVPPYTVATCGPQIKLCPKTAMDAELVPDVNTEKYLEVGILDGLDPKRYQYIGKSPAKRKNLREKDGIIDRNESFLRVFTPAKAFAKGKREYVAGCLLQEGHLSPREVYEDDIFFYPEFLKDTPDNATKALIKQSIDDACKSRIMISWFSKKRTRSQDNIQRECADSTKNEKTTKELLQLVRHRLITANAKLQNWYNEVKSELGSLDANASLESYRDKFLNDPGQESARLYLDACLLRNSADIMAEIRLSLDLSSLIGKLDGILNPKNTS